MLTCVVWSGNRYTHVLHPVHKNVDFFLLIDCFLTKYSATLATQPSGGCSLMWMTTHEPPFVLPLTGSQKPPVFVIETGTFHRNVIRRN